MGENSYNYNDYKKWIEKIARSKYFTSENDVRLLQYLIDATNQGKTLKETIIAIEFFNRDGSFDSGTDSIVRSNIYNLRKKLELYYQNEGSEDEVRFEIPKGSYRVRFSENPPKNSSLSNGRQFLLKTGIILLAISTLIFAFLYFFDKKNVIEHPDHSKNPVWSYYIRSGDPLLIVLGDYFMMERIQLPDSSYNFIRDPQINNQDDFSGYLDEHPELGKNIKKLGQSYFGEEIPRCFNQLLQIFKGTKKKIRMKYSSTLSPNDVRENDIIFVGDYATLGLLKPFFESSGYRYSNIPSSLYILNEKQDTIESLSLDNPDQSVFQNDYAVVSNINGYENKKILFFLSFLPFGKSEAMYKLSESSFIEELAEISDPMPENWNLLMKVSGLRSSGLYYQIVRFDPLN